MNKEITEAGMGAKVLGCGHASQLFKVEYLEHRPHIHLHYLTDDEEYDREGNGKVELVCHGCGASLLVKYDDGGTRRQFLAIRNRFSDKHQRCTNRGFEHKCPDYRSTLEVLDTRRQTKRVSAA